VLTVDDAQPTALMEAIALSDRIVDIRPVTMRDAGHVLTAILDGSPWIGNIDLTPEQITDLPVRATFLAGRQVYCR
jgi:hypothetical protein